MTRDPDKKRHLDKELNSMHQQVEQLEQELRTQKQIAFAAGIFQGDVTIRTLLESLAEGVIVCDQEGRVILLNRRAQELFGYKADEVVGRSLNVFIPERYLTTHATHIQKFFNDPHIRPMGKGVDLTGKRKDGVDFPIEVSLSYLNTEVGILGIAFITDITERKRSEWALKLRNEELNAFAHTVAHDLKASMTTLIGYSEVLAEMHRTLSETERDGYLTELAKNGRRMSNIIDELLVFASIRKEEVVHRPLEMSQIVDNTIQRLNYMIKEHKAKVIVPDSFHIAMGYAPWVEEVWYNYVTNAVKYGGEPPVVEIGSELRGDEVKFWVRDNGQGLTSDQRLKLFEPFSQLEPPRFQGYGLGLSIVKKIVEKLNGRVEVESEAGQGSVFSFYLNKQNA